MVAREISYARWSLEAYGIGKKLRALRSRKRLTLSRLAGETGLSTALLSKLETDRMVPTLQTLVTICQVFGVGLSYFFIEPQRHTVSITRQAQWMGTGQRSDSIRFTPLHPPQPEPALKSEIIELASDGSTHTPTIGGQVKCVLYVLEGQLQVDSGLMQEKLATGDCAYLDSEVPMTWSASGKARCLILAVFPGNSAA